MGRHQARRPARPRKRANVVRALLAVAVVAEVTSGALVVADRSNDPPTPPEILADAGVDPDTAAATAEAALRKALADRRNAAIRELLARRARAMTARDRAGFLEIVDPRSPAFRQAQDRLFANLADVPIGTWTYELDAAHEHAPDPGLAQRLAADEVWIPEVRFRYSLAGFDPEPTELRQLYTFVRRGGRWYAHTDDPFPNVPSMRTARELWDLGPVDVVRTPRALVIGRTGRASLLRQIAAQAAASVPRVTAVWGTDWPQRVVVLVPGSQAELGTLISEGNDLSQIAAVAVAQLGGDQGDYHPVGNRVIVNPPNFSRLSDLGRRVVLQHEITHVATRDVTSGVPGWLVEGFADYVGYLGTGVPVRAAARELRAEVRAGRVPPRLPADDEFTGTNPRLAQAYEGAWLACLLVVERTSQAHLVRFYRTLGTLAQNSDAEVRAAWRRVLSTTPEAFVEAWRAYLRRELG